MAFQVDDFQIAGAPGWADSESYDIEAATGDGRTVANTRMPALLETVLMERFGLVFHRETKEAPIYLLEAAKNGPKLKPAEEGREPSMNTNSHPGRADMKLTGVSMPEFASVLKRQVHRNVADHTGIGGHFDIEFEWDPDQSGDMPGPSLFTALQDELGLRLAPAKGPVEMIVIDRIEKASGN